MMEAWLSSSLKMTTSSAPAGTPLTLLLAAGAASTDTTAVLAA
jgi:hypothetical protein